MAPAGLTRKREDTPLLTSTPPTPRRRRWLILVMMILAKSWDPIAMKISRHGHKEYPYSPGVCTLIAEILKFVVSAVALLVELKLSPRSQRRRLLAVSWRSNVQMCVPALVYALANLLSFEVGRLTDPGAYQMLGNLKIATTAFIFRVLLRRPQSRRQWLAIAILLCGAALASASRDAHGTGIRAKLLALTRTSFAAFAVALLQASLGSLANVYTELLFKAAEGNSLFFQNLQLYAYGIGVMAVTLLANEGRDLAAHGLWHGWSASTWLAAASLAAFGLSCAFVFRYLDNMLYVICIFVSGAADGAIYQEWPDLIMLPAAALVIIALRLYYTKPAEPQGYHAIPTADAASAAAKRPGRIKQAEAGRAEAPSKTEMASAESL